MATSSCTKACSATRRTPRRAARSAAAPRRRGRRTPEPAHTADAAHAAAAARHPGATVEQPLGAARLVGGDRHEPLGVHLRVERRDPAGVADLLHRVLHEGGQQAARRPPARRGR
nr:hypothetical protein [Angustibacter aerolatus]